MKELFVERRFNGPSQRVIDAANQILEEYRTKGYVLTLRQLYYQFVARDLVRNTMHEYKRIGSIINDARLAGQIDWDMLEDRTRNLLTVPHYANPSKFLTEKAEEYAEPLWADQPAYCEVWVEKDALIGVIERPCIDLRVPFFACRGYASQSELYSAGKRLRRQVMKGKAVTVFHLGDHDPSGLDMTRDNNERLTMFAEVPVHVMRLALNDDQIIEFDPPPNPAKMTDTRAYEYVSAHGDQSWELDALDPTVIDNLLRRAIEGIIDKPRMTKAAEHERKNKNDLRLLAPAYDAAINAAKLRNVAGKLKGMTDGNKTE